MPQAPRCHGCHGDHMVLGNMEGLTTKNKMTTCKSIKVENDILCCLLMMCFKVCCCKKNTFKADSHPWDLNSSFALNDAGKFPNAQKIMGVGGGGFHAAHEYKF